MIDKIDDDLYRTLFLATHFAATDVLQDQVTSDSNPVSLSTSYCK